jgi:glycosyltransferase involved in cell wall biosynthesis
LGWDRFAQWLMLRYKINASDLDYPNYTVLRSFEELCLAYQCRGEWQWRFPEALQNLAATHDLLVWIREHEGASDPQITDWLSRIEAEIDSADFPRQGMNVLANFCYPLGLQRSAFGYVHSLNVAGVATSCRNVLSDPRWDDPVPNELLGFELYDTTLVHIQPENVSFAYERAGLAPREGVYRIAIWWWETDVVPERWKLATKFVDEVWVASRFVADALRRAFDVPVHCIPMGFELGPVRRIDLGSYGVPSDSFVFLFIFDLTSVFERKNPLGLIAAFEQAFCLDEKVKLIIKPSRGDRRLVDYERFKKRAKDVGAIIVDQRLPREELNGLIEACDCYVSLHRSEGLGLTLAEAMMLGKPTIATAYSGNLDFMDESNSLLVGYDLIELERDFFPYEKGHRWADPSIPEAVRAMRWVFENPTDARSLGERARLSSVRYFSPGQCGRRMLERLDQISRARSGKRNDLKANSVGS